MSKYKNESERKLGRSRTIQRYQQKTMTNLMLRFHNRIDADIIEQISNQTNKTAYIKALVRADIASKRS